MRGRSFQWQHECEYRTAIGPVLCPDAAAVRLDDAPADRQPQPDTLTGRRLPAIELIKDALFFAWLQAGASVRDFDDV